MRDWTILIILTLLAINGCRSSKIETGSVALPSAAESQRPLKFTKVAIVERYNDDWRPNRIPRTLQLNGEAAERVGRIFPQIEVSPPPLGEVIALPMRFEIELTRSNGDVVYVYVDPPLQRWWDERSNQVYRVSRSDASYLANLMKDAKAVELLPKSPVIQVEMTDRLTSDGYVRRPPNKVIIQNERASEFASMFPELGLTREPAMPFGGVTHFTIEITRANGEHSTIEVETTHEPWKWSENQRTWIVSPATVTAIQRLAREASPIVPTTIQN